MRHCGDGLQIKHGDFTIHHDDVYLENCKNVMSEMRIT